MFSESELTEISSDDYGEKSTKKTTKTAAGKQKKEGYRLRNVLKPGRTTQYTAKALYDQIHQNDIDLDPDYQRDVVWSDAKQIGLIDSIFRNFYVPPIIFSVTTEDDGTEKRVCIDGKQRLTSIQKFIGGIIPHRDPFTNEKLWFMDSQGGPKRKLLPPQYRTLFQNKQIVCIEYNDLPGDLEREVFQRVQMGMALTTAEKLQAISGPWPDLVREILQLYHSGIDGIASNMDFEQSRARDFQNVAQILFYIDHLPEHAQGTPLQIERWLQQRDGPSDGIRAKTHDVFRIYKELANHKQLKAPFKKPARVAPAEFIMTAVLIAVHKNALSLPQLSQAIGLLRSKTRAEHVDVRTNSKVYKTMFNVIYKEIKTLELKATPGQEAAGKTLPMNTPAKRKRSPSESSAEVSLSGNRAENKSKFSRKQPTPSQSADVSKPQSSNLVASSTSQVKLEDIRTKVTAKPDSVVHPFGPRGLEKIRAAKQQMAEIYSGMSSGPPSPSAHSILPNSLPSRPAPNPPPIKNTSLEAMMMSQPFNPPHSPVPHPTPSLTRGHGTAADHNGVLPPSSSIPIPHERQNHSSASLDAGHTSYSGSDGYRRHDYFRSSREDDGGYHRTNGSEDRRDRDSDRSFRGGEREWDRDKEKDRDRDRDRGRGNSYSRNSYPGWSDRKHYHKSRDNAWDSGWRGSGYKDH